MRTRRHLYTCTCGATLDFRRSRHCHICGTFYASTAASAAVVSQWGELLGKPITEVLIADRGAVRDVLVDDSSPHDCDYKCTNAHGDVCRCSCGGVNHGVATLMGRT